MKRLKKLNRFKKFILIVLMISLPMMIAYKIIEIVAAEELQDKCLAKVSKDTEKIKECITTSGEVSEDTIKKVCKIVQTQVPDEAWNYLVNSGGKLIIVEGNDIKEYVLENYGDEAGEYKKITGYCPYEYRIKQLWGINVGVLQKVDVIIAQDCLKGLVHEFCHVLDYSHEYSKTEEFQSFYQDADKILQKVFQDAAKVSYYTRNSKEFFAEMSAQYIKSNLNRVDSELEDYLAEIIKH